LARPSRNHRRLGASLISVSSVCTRGRVSAANHIRCHVALPSRLEAKEQDIRERLVANGFREEFLGDHQPPATHYRLGDAKSGFYAEFPTPLIGSQYDRKGTAKATGRVGGVTSQKLRHLDLVLDMPWHVEIDKAKGFPLSASKRVQIPNPTCFLAQKLLIHSKRSREERAKDIFIYT